MTAQGETAVNAAGPWHLHGVILPDGTGPTHLWIDGGRLSTVPVPGARDVQGAWVLPGGLVDAHAHLTMNFGRVMPHADGSDALMAANADAQRQAGVLAVRDAGCAWGGVPTPDPAWPRLQRAGALNAPPGRGYPHVCRWVAGDELVSVALAEVEAGAHWVKILGDFPGPDGNWFAAPSNYPRDVLATLVREVHAAGARVMAHSTGLGAADLVAAGVDSIEHGMVLTRDLIQEMADRRIAWSLTMATAHKHVGPLAAQQSPVGAYIRGQLDRVRDLLPFAAERGVPLLAGTDEIGHGTLVDELTCLSQYGLRGDQALAAGSTEARKYLRYDDEVDGVDLTVYPADPRHDLSVLRRPAAIFARGIRVA